MTKPYPFQEDGIKHISDFNGRALIADEMGLGKTLQSLEWMKRNKKIATPAIVICPASLKWNWEAEALKHIGAKTNIINGRTPPKTKISPFDRERNLTIINYDILGPWIPYLQSLKPKTIILDECTYVKSSGAKRSKHTKDLIKGVLNLICLTGTPLLSRPIEIWQVMHMLDPERWSSESKFGHQFCGAKLTRWGWDFRGACNLKTLNKKLIEGGMIRRLKTEVLNDLPAKTRHVVLTHLTAKQQREYHQAATNFSVWLSKQDKLKAKTAKKAASLSKMGYLKRLVAGFKHDSIIEWINTFLAESTGKLIIFGLHKAVLDPLIELYGNLAEAITGRVNQKKRKVAEIRFQTDPSCRLIFGNIQAMGMGLTLTAASTVLFIELGWTPGEHSQAEDRPHRIGQTNHVQCFYLIADKTIEVRLCSMLQAKQETLTATIDGGESPDDLDIYSELEKELKAL